MSSRFQDGPVPILPADGPLTSNVTILTQLPDDKSDNRHHGNVQVQLQYLADDPLYDTVKPLQVVPGFQDREGKSNVRLSLGESETLNDVRGRFDEFTLDDNGFKYVNAPTAFKDWSSQPKIGQYYLKELEQLLQREVEGCDEIIFYDARIRQESEEGVRVEGLSYNPFARQVHIDNTESSVITKIRNLTEMKADYLLQGRARIINIWRPIKHPVYDCGLAVADGGKLRNGDVIECDRYRRDTGQFWDTMAVIKYRPGYDWYYMSEQSEDSVLLFKNYDSDTKVKARHCLHTAFDMPPNMIPPGTPTRESVEVRALVFTHPEDGRRPSEGTLIARSATIEHPLAVSLEKGDLKHIDDEHSIMDHLRKDIDEAHEIKDAELLLRKRKIRALEKSHESLMLEHNQLAEQITIQESYVTALHDQVGALKEQLKLAQPELRKEIQSLSAQLAEARIREQSRSRDINDGVNSMINLHGIGAQRAQLLRVIEGQRQDIQKWMAEADGQGSEAVSRCWQASVDEAVRREREKDAFVIKALRDEVEALRARCSAAA